MTLKTVMWLNVKFFQLWYVVFAELDYIWSVGVDKELNEPLWNEHS